MTKKSPDPDVPKAAEKAKATAKKTAKASVELTNDLGRASYPHRVHPGLVPGVAVEDRNVEYKTDKLVVVVAGVLIIGFIAWGLISTESLSSVSSAALEWVVQNIGWLFTILAVVLLIYMLLIAFSRYGHIPLGRDNEEPEFSFGSWVAMLFSAGMGIGLLFFGTYEPMYYFLTPPPGANVEPQTYEALNASMAQVMLHWGFNAWAFYAVVGAAIAYNSYRRGRSPLMSRILTPILGAKRTDGFFGRTVDMLAIVATLFGTAASLGIGSLQIAHGVEVVTGIGPIGNAGVILIVALLTAAFIASAVSGVSRGIRYLSNTNMIVALFLVLFIFIMGPTVYILNLIPTSLTNYLSESFYLLSQSAAWGPETGAFVDGWTVFYWAWWVSWAPFVGMFIAKISRGRTIRQFTVVVLLIPTIVCLLAFSIFGGTAMHQQLNGAHYDKIESSQEMLFELLGNLPLTQVTATLAMVSIVIFFVTSADSASLVMGILSQQGKTDPDGRVVAFWGLCLSGIAIVGLLLGKEDAIKGLQNLIIVTSVPFALVIIAVMFAFWKDLATDPMSIREKYAKESINNAIRSGMKEHGDDFGLSVCRAENGEGAGANYDSSAKVVTEWYNDESLREAWAKDGTVDEEVPIVGEHKVDELQKMDDDGTVDGVPKRNKQP